MGAIMTSRQAAELDHAFERNSWNAKDVKKLSQGDILTKIFPVVIGIADVVMKEHIIDCDADPFVPTGWKVEKHERNGQLGWDPKIIKIYLCEHQRGISWERGYEVYEELKDKPVLNANVLDYLLAHPEIIPVEWEEERVCFWGTIYSGPNGKCRIRCLRRNRNNKKWRWSQKLIDTGWHSEHPAALLVS